LKVRELRPYHYTNMALTKTSQKRTISIAKNIVDVFSVRRRDTKNGGEI